MREIKSEFNVTKACLREGENTLYDANRFDNVFISENPLFDTN